MSTLYKKTRDMLSFIIQNWNYLDFNLRLEFYDFLIYYKDKIIYNKFESNFNS